jgi:hypothetical protein
VHFEEGFVGQGCPEEFEVIDLEGSQRLLTVTEGLQKS